MPFGFSDQDAAVRLSKMFVERSVWRLSKVLVDNRQVTWIGSPKKLVVDLKESKMEQVTDSEECSRTATAISCKSAFRPISHYEMYICIVFAVLAFCHDQRWQMLLSSFCFAY